MKNNANAGSNQHFILGVFNSVGDLIVYCVCAILTQTTYSVPAIKYCILFNLQIVFTLCF